MPSNQLTPTSSPKISPESSPKSCSRISPEKSTPDVQKPLPIVPIVQQTPQTPPPYSAFPTKHRTLILTIVTAAGFLGPLAGGIYLPVLPTLVKEFKVSTVVINATVSVFMVVFAFAVSIYSSSDLKLLIMN